MNSLKKILKSVCWFTGHATNMECNSNDSQEIKQTVKKSTLTGWKSWEWYLPKCFNNYNFNFLRYIKCKKHKKSIKI